MDSIKCQEIRGDNIILSVRKMALGHSSILEWPSQSRDLVEAAHKPKTSKLEANAHEEWAKGLQAQQPEALVWLCIMFAGGGRK